MSTALFWLGIAAPFLIVALHFLDNQRQRTLMERLGELPAVQRMMAARSPRRRAIKAVLTGLGIGLVLVAASGPTRTGRRVQKRKGMDLVIALDVSKSMLVGDVEVGEPQGGWPADLKPEEPRPVPADPRWVQGTRLERARQILDALADKLPDDRIGIILFAGASVHFPLTDDEHLAMELAHLVGTSDLMGGSDLAEALRIGKCLLREDLDDVRVGCSGIGRRGHGGEPLEPRQKRADRDEVKEERGKAILLISDGGDSNERVLQEVDLARQLGVSLYFLGVGSDKGGVVPELDWDGKVTGAKTDAQGKPVRSRLDREGLRALAQIAGAESHYVEVPATGAFDVTPILDQLNQVQRGELERTEEDRPRPIYHWFLFPGLLLLVIEASIGLRKRVKHPEAVP